MKVHKITQVRSEYTSARLISSNLEHRLAGTRFQRQPGYLPPEIDFTTSVGISSTMAVRDYDVRYLDRVAPAKAIEHLDLIHRARRGILAARNELFRRTRDTHRKILSRNHAVLSGKASILRKSPSSSTNGCSIKNT